jgi:hypothetical protein
MSRIDGSGGYIHSFCAIYSFKMSFWMVPPSCESGILRFWAEAIYMAKIIAAGALIVIEVVILPSGMSLKRTSISSSESIATPHLPTSPFERGWSESYPMSVGRSKATLRPVSPFLRRYLNRLFVCLAVPYPENSRRVQSRPRYMEG